MGLIRVLLAAAVVMGHAPGWGLWTPDGIASRLMSPYYAVQAFFVISGFYMALIHERYAGLPFVSYGYRYARLIITYWIVLLVRLGFCAARDSVPASDMSAMPALSAIANTTLLGIDAVNFFQDTGWLFVPQAWSLGTELLF